MYASSQEELASAKDSFFVDEDDDFLDPLSNYRNRVEKFLERGDEWLLLRRQDVITRGNNTNNYSESTMRVLKDIILSRTKGVQCRCISGLLQHRFECLPCQASVGVCSWSSCRPKACLHSLVRQD